MQNFNIYTLLIRNIRINPSVKHHLLIGIFISFWFFIFAFFIQPFDDGTISAKQWLLISGGFSFIAFLCYGLITLLQKKVYDKIAKWNIGFELISLLSFYLLFLFSTYFYYKSPVLNGGYRFVEFLTVIILKSALISMPIFLLARRYSVKLIPAKTETATISNDDIIIRGENKLDILKINRNDLVCISNSQNYVEIFYTDEHHQLKTKLIRSTLKKVQEDVDFLIQIHRSHLINPTHFKAWKNQNTILLAQMELPVSKTYKEQLLSL